MCPQHFSILKTKECHVDLSSWKILKNYNKKIPNRIPSIPFKIYGKEKGKKKTTKYELFFLERKKTGVTNHQHLNKFTTPNTNEFIL